MKKITSVELRSALLSAAEDLIGRELELSQLDSVVGDGDHGITIRKGYMKVKDAVLACKSDSMYDILFAAGMGLADTAGGAIGPILASMFIGFSTAVMGKEELDLKGITDMFAGGLKGVQDLGGAKPGDCTMVDTFYPFVESLKNAGDVELEKALADACAKGFEGSESTKNMAAKLGRARNLAERSIGYIDAGSRSMYYFLKAFSDGIVA